MSRRVLRNTGRKFSLVGLIGTFALACSLESAVAAPKDDVRKIISAPGTPSEADKKTITSYMDPFFRSFLKPVDGMTVPNLRKEYGNIVSRVGKTPGHDFLNATAYKYANAIVTNKQFSTAAKYNAMLMLADLNESDVPGAIKPHREALMTLGRTLAAPNSDADYLKAAALIGITRLAEEKALPPNIVAPLSGLLLKILAEPEPPAGRTDSAHNFMRRSAARALAAIGSPGPNNEVVLEMRKIMDDPNAKLTMRCEMVQFLSQITFPAESKIDLQELANLIGHQTVDICDQELLRAEEEKREPSRRILMYALRTADAGLSNLKSPEAAAFVSKLRNKIQQLLNQLDDVTKVPDGKIVEIMVPELEAIRELLKARPEPAPSAVPAASATAARPAN